MFMGMSAGNEAAFHFVVVAHSRLFDSYRRRVVIPLVRKAELGHISKHHLNPTYECQIAEKM